MPPPESQEDPLRELVKRAEQVVAGAPATNEQILQLVAALQNQFDFYGLARKLLDRAAQQVPPDDRVARETIEQQRAQCYYKDEELLPSWRFQRALEALERIDLRKPTAAPETWRLAGAIYKRMWEVTGQLELLYEALAFYRSAYDANPDADAGYGGVNAAYILQLLAHRARRSQQRSAVASTEADRLQQEAKAIYADLKARLAKLATPERMTQLWFVATRAEVEFALGNYGWAAGDNATATACYALARQHLASYADLLKKEAKQAGHERAAEWKVQSTFRQFVMLARVQGVVAPGPRTDAAPLAPQWQVLTALLGDGTASALSCHRGKVGLALSGGGFRASFYHLGVLARLAETDLLRSVDVLSTVSGGSIVGAHYYLELRQLLRTKRDGEITREHYVEIVERIQNAFLDGVKTNLRMRAFASAAVNARMVRDKHYTRSHRMGELYESELYSRIADGHPAGTPRQMQALVITPAGWHGPDFKPKFDNWRRQAKVPTLLLNATSLNSGHLWHFTARWMGEPPGVIGAEVDANRRYRRLWYSQAPRTSSRNSMELQEYPLGYAVSASACVPGLFEPLVIDELYSNTVVRLVDGGVNDNQGVAGLLDEGCTVIFCSDASGQMGDITHPAPGLLAPLWRSSQHIFMDRIRELEYQDLKARFEDHPLGGFCFIHLMKDIAGAPVDWRGCEAPASQPPRTGCTDYGVDPEIQRQLAAIRTDLDSFTEVEAYSLMLSGYQMARHELQRLRNAQPDGPWGSFDVDAQPDDPRWAFLALKDVAGKPATDGDPRRTDLGVQLAAGESQFFKVLKLSPSLRSSLSQALRAIGVTVLALFVSGQVFGSRLFIAVGVGLGLLLLTSIAVTTWNWIAPRTPLHNYPAKIISAVLGYVAANVHLRFFDRLFLERGSLVRLLGLGAGKSGPESRNSVSPTPSQPDTPTPGSP